MQGFTSRIDQRNHHNADEVVDKYGEIKRQGIY
jgi:hypothetical protein